jgi:hypothetical protein
MMQNRRRPSGGHWQAGCWLRGNSTMLEWEAQSVVGVNCHGTPGRRDEEVCVSEPRRSCGRAVMMSTPLLDVAIPGVVHQTSLEGVFSPGAGSALPSFNFTD